jgi:hypothetical protein
MHYRLRGHEPVLVRDAYEWAEWYENFDARRVAESYVAGVRVSTVFLGIDHNYVSGGVPVLFETMVFVSDEQTVEAKCARLRRLLVGEEEICVRYATWDEAAAGHEVVVAYVKGETRELEI